MCSTAGDSVWREQTWWELWSGSPSEEVRAIIRMMKVIKIMKIIKSFCAWWVSCMGFMVEQAGKGRTFAAQKSAPCLLAPV